MSIEEVILEKVRALPPAKKAEVLQFVSGRREMWSGFPRNDIE